MDITPERIDIMKKNNVVLNETPEMSARKKNLIEDINKTRQTLDTVYCNFQYVSDPDLIDCYIYEMNSVQLRYKYLLRQLQEMTC